MGTNVIRHLLLVTFIAALALSRAAHSEDIDQSDNPVRIGTTQSLTGHYKEFGIEQLRGLQMWAADVNARGELLGRPVEIVYYDDGSRDAGTVTGFTNLIGKDNVDVLVGPYSSSLTLAATLVAEKYDIPMVTTAASDERIWNRGLKNVFGADTPVGDYLNGLQVAADAGVKTVAFLYAGTDFGDDLAAVSRSRIEERGLELVLFERYAPEQRDFASLARRLKEVNADMIFGVSYLEDSVEIVRALKGEGVKPNMLGFTVGPGLREFADELGPDAEGILGVVQWLRTSREPGAQDFAYRFARRYGYHPGVYAVMGYSAGEILEAAIRLAGTTEHSAVREQLRTMYFQALIGSYAVNDTGRQIGRRNLVLQWQNGERRLVAPEQLANSPLIYPR
ncbi:Leucine-, isoleucine-, valine-, threonine-, and alanine-binding protein [Halioglobus japonicus]|nr:Leucine-, isoleucine-, valine-, threonine-, and alanine-binding protein [Halioglobus japonicus]